MPVKRLLAAVAVLGLVLAASAYSLTGASAAAHTMFIGQSCQPDGSLLTRFDWRGNDRNANQQWLDISQYNNGWAPGTFDGIGPLPSTQDAAAVANIGEGLTVYVRVNQLMANGAWDASPTFYFIAGLCSPMSPRTPPPQQPPADSSRVRVLAPIEEISEAPSAQHGGYAVRGKAGLPSGCAQPGGQEVSRQGNDIFVKVYNTMPTGNPPCTLIYGIYDFDISLGSGLVSGQTYRVDVNGTVISFTAN